MKQVINFIKTTIAGGILVLIPVVVSVIILAKVFSFLQRFSDGIARRLSFASIGGVGISTMISIVLLLIICFLAGVVVRTKSARGIVGWLEDRVLVYIPGYAYLKAISANALTKEGTANWKPATVFIDDNEVICFVIDESENYCTVFLPSAPTPSSGMVGARHKSNIRYLSLTVRETILLIKQFGKGAAKEIERLNAAEIQKKSELQ
jgi:uncharacterized membrane protein